MSREKPKLLRKNLIEDMKRVIDEASNDYQKAHRVRIYNRFMKMVSDNKTEDDLWNAIMSDYDVFCATQFQNQYGDPFFPSPWQSEATGHLIDGKYREFFIFACRRAGKSSWVATLLIWYCSTHPNTIVQIYAPTDKQLYIINYIVDNLTSNEYVKDKVVARPFRHNLLKRFVKFSNNSEVDTWSMGRGFTGDSARGSGGNMLVVEEVGLWKRGDLDAVIKPMKREVFSEKTVFYIGTPLLTYNPDLPLEWERALAMENTWTKSFTCWDAMKEGVRKPETMIETFHDYGIPCEIVRSVGVCPKYLPEIFDSLPEDWTCPFNEVCMENDDFVREELIMFPKMSGALFTKKLVTDSLYDSFGLVSSPGRDINRVYVMSADCALLMDYTQILVGEMFTKLCSDGINRPAIRVIYWREISPEEIKGNDPYPVVDAYKTTNRIFNPKWILADASTTGGVINVLASKGEFAIPKSKWVQNSAAEAKDIPGIVWSGEFKDEMFKNLKNQLIWGTIEMPMVQPFASKIIDELTSLEAKPIITGRYDQIVSRMGRKKDLASSLAMLAWILHNKGATKYTRTIAVSRFARRYDAAPLGMTNEARRLRRTDTPESIPTKKKTVHIGFSGGR